MQIAVSAIALLMVYGLFQVGKSFLEIIAATWPFLFLGAAVLGIVALGRAGSAASKAKHTQYDPKHFEPMYESSAVSVVQRPSVTTTSYRPAGAVDRDDHHQSERVTTAFQASAIGYDWGKTAAGGRTRARSKKVLSDTTLQPSKGLIIRAEFLEKILAGRKTWEMRGTRINIRGPIALIQKGSGKIFGIAEVVDSIGPLTRDEIEANIDKHAVERSRFDEVLKTYKFAWVLANAKRLRRPVDYVHPSGAVKFVALDATTVGRVRAQL